MLRRSTRSRNFFRKLVVDGVNNSKTAIQNDCLMRLYDADAELKAISSELDSFDGKKDPIRCNLLVNQLRTAQDKVISLLFQLMDDCNCERASRDYRMKFPDEILLSEGSESLNGQIWFGAECLSAGSNILNHTKESTMLRPMAKTLTQHLDSLRNDLRDLVIDGGGAARINQALIKKMVAFDHIFATFEYEYVKTMLPIRTVAEIEKLQEVAVLFSETLIDCVRRGLIKQDDIDEFQPIVMIAVPRLSIVRGLLYKNENPIYTRHKSQMCSLFQPFHGPLHSIRKLLRGLSSRELFTLEKMLANDQSSNSDDTQEDEKIPSRCNEQTDTASCEICHSSKCEHSCECSQENQAGTSNNYSNLLMDGLQYPVGSKRQEASLQGASDSYGPNDRSEIDQGYTGPQNYNCHFEGSASSSMSTRDPKSNANKSCQHGGQPRNSSSEMTPSPSSSVSSNSHNCANCDLKDQNNRTFEEKEVARDGFSSDKKDCDKSENCCLSPPESDTQLEKLIANFDASIGGPNQEPQNSRHSNQLDITTPTAATNATTDISIQTVTSSDQTIPSTTRSIGILSQNDANICEKSHVKCDNLKTARKGVRSGQSNQESEVLEGLFQKQSQQLLHRLFVSISGVADQLQSNFASDLRFVLRHIFSSELANSEENDESEDEAHEVIRARDDEGDYSNNDNSDTSLPIEQGIEAHEVVNLIDLESGYTPNENYSYEQGAYSDQQRQLAPTDSTFYSQHHTGDSHLGDDTLTTNDFLPNSTHGLNNSISSSQPQVLHDGIGTQLVGSNMMPQSDTRLIVDSDVSPNEPSIMDDAHRRHQSLQRHLQAVMIAARAARLSGRLVTMTNEQVAQIQINEGGSTAQQPTTERRSRHHAGSSRSRRQRGPPVWVPDQLVVSCSSCSSPFTLFRRRHHCRACGQIFCAECSRFTKNLDCWGYSGPVRVCELCFNLP